MKNRKIAFGRKSLAAASGSLASDKPFSSARVILGEQQTIGGVWSARRGVISCASERDRSTYGMLERKRDAETVKVN